MGSELALIDLFGRTFLSLMALPGQTEIVLTALEMDLLIMGLSKLQVELKTGKIQGKMGKSS